MAALLLSGLWACVGVRVCAHVTLPLSSLHPSIQQKTSTQKAGRSLDGWRGCWTAAGRGGAGSPLLLSSLPVARTRCSPPHPHPHVHCCLVVARGLAGGCHIAQIQTVPGVSRMCWDHPGEHFVSSQGAAAQLLSGTCLAWERAGSVSFKCLGKLSPPACLPSLARGAGTGPSRSRGAVWCQELAVGER